MFNTALIYTVYVYTRLLAPIVLEYDQTINELNKQITVYQVWMPKNYKSYIVRPPSQNIVHACHFHVKLSFF